MPLRPKIITDNIYRRDVNVGWIQPIIDTPEFQRLGGKIQLGMTPIVFRSATHTRMAHSIGAYFATIRLIRRLKAAGSITYEEGGALMVFAAVHDIGHPAFSHVTEDFCPRDDDEQTVELIEGPLRKPIEDANFDFELVRSLARHKNPLYLAVHDKNLGMEKLDYLRRDGASTLGGYPASIDLLDSWIFWEDSKLVIDEKGVNHAIDTMQFYVKMYEEVYFRKALVIAQRMFHKMVHHLILAGEVNPIQLMNMTDAELIGVMFFSKLEVVRTLYPLLRDRQLYREAVVIRPESFAEETRVVGKSISVQGVSPETMQRLIYAPRFQKKNHAALEEIEQEIAQLLGLKPIDILLVPVFNPERFVAKDVNILGGNGQIYSLKKRRPEDFVAMEAKARRRSALRICVAPQHRAQVSSAATAEKVRDLILAHL